MDGNDKNASNPSNNDQIKTKPNIIEGYEKIEDFTKDGYKALIEATKNSNTLPQERDWDFYNTHESFKNLMTSEGNDILQLINTILKQQNVYGNIKNRDLDEKIELVIEANDIILERVANHIDEISGIRKNPQLPVEIQTVTAELPISGSWNRMNSAKISIETSTKSTPSSIVQSPNSIRLLTGKNIQRPQKYFKDRIDNSKSPWEPRIKDKPNNLKPLAVYLEYTEDGTEEIFCHPYEFELERFEPSQKQLIKVIPSVPRSLDDTPLVLVENADQIDPMLQDLRKYNELAVDLEHHSYRTYMGITCLMQISTGETDYLIDTLKLRDKLHVLNEVFTKPSVVKVFHGADNDVLWLQRDLSIYVVNMFDTHQAAKQLSYAHLSLAYLLRRFCQIDADKHFQLADWRIRPLPEELKAYAREDTHYLLYIYHMMRNELLALGENVLKGVLTSSTQICKRRYEKPVIRDDTHMELYRKCKKLFDNRQMFALKHLYEWRDDLAREEDESIGYVLPNHMMLQIAELLPREMQGILACCNPIPPLVRANLLELHKIILKAREQSVIKPILAEDTRNRGNTQQTAKINIDNVLNCPHDLIKSEEFRDDLPTLLGSIIPDEITNINSCIVNIKSDCDSKYKSRINIFETPENSDDDTQRNMNANKNSKMKQLKFLGPYERYKLVKSYMQDEEKKQEKEPVKQVTTINNDKDNAERVAALQEHFKIMAAATSQIIPADNIEKSVVILGRPSEKRKRLDDDDDEYEDINTSQYQQQQHQQQQHQQQQQQQQNNKRKRYRGKKKPNNNKNNPNESLAEVRKTEKRNNKFKNKNLPTPEGQQQQQQLNKQNNRNQYRKRKRNETNTNQQPQQQQQQQQQNKRAKRSENFESFDYSAVNFQQFQGGAGSAHQNKNIGSNFKARGSKNKKTQNIGRSNTRSATFAGTSRGNPRGRGGGNRGRGTRGTGRYY